MEWVVEIAMEIGMLWFDNDKLADLDIKVHRAVAYYIDKYRQEPNLCFVNPCMFSSNGDETKKLIKVSDVKGEVEIRESNLLLPNHFWIGIKQQKS